MADRLKPLPRQPPPMREVTKGWFTMRETSKTVEQFQQEDQQKGRDGCPSRPSLVAAK